MQLFIKSGILIGCGWPAFAIWWDKNSTSLATIQSPWHQMSRTTQDSPTANLWHRKRITHVYLSIRVCESVWIVSTRRTNWSSGHWPSAQLCLKQSSEFWTNVNEQPNCVNWNSSDSTTEGWVMPSPKDRNCKQFAAGCGGGAGPWENKIDQNLKSMFYLMVSCVTFMYPFWQMQGFTNE